MKNILLIFAIASMMTVSAVAGDSPSYAFSKVVDMSVEEAITKVTAELKNAGFGIVSELDVQATMKSKLNEEMKPYKILGACNPKFALESIQAEMQIGLFLPCNVIVYENADGKTVVSAVDPVAMMAAVENPELSGIAQNVRDSLKKVIDNM